MPQNISPDKRITGQIKISRFLFPEKIPDVASFTQSLRSSLQRDVSEFLDVLFLGSLDLDASDVHFETQSEIVKIRLRLDGLLRDLVTLPQKEYFPLLSRLKLISGVKLNITAAPQDGRFSIVDGQSLIEVRLSTLPSEYGESVVLRLLNPTSLISLESLGLRSDLLEVFTREISRPNGLILVTGPTGSGKTTTLYAFLKKVQQPELKIITIEDPIEYHLTGISQTQVDPSQGYDFASGLRAIVRQDPDVILVGEIRDQETAEIALQASLTGHLVFSTLHTNDAVSTIARLRDLGAKPPTIAAAINLAIGQRLIRRLCPRCAKTIKASPADLEKLRQGLANLPPQIKKPALGPETEIAQARGCSFCGSTGYRRRLGIFEAFLIDAQMEKFLLTESSSAGLKEKAQAQGLVTLYQDGLLRVLEKATTIEELERVAGPPSARGNTQAPA